MRNCKLILSALSLILMFVFTACQNQKPEEQKKEEKKDVQKAAFVANPKPVPKQDVKTLEIGSPAPDFKLPGVDGKFYTLADFKDAKVLLIIFTCNHCPTAQAYEDRIISVAKDYQAKGVQMVAISPNSPLGLLYEELGYTDLNDDYAEMVIRAKNRGFNFPYLYDGDTQEVSLKYGPVATPHAFVFDAERKLQYVGRLDKIEKPGKANAEDLRGALDAVLANKKPAEPVTKTFGCSTKWGWKIDSRDKVDKEWQAREIKIEKIDTEGVKKLLKNENSDKLRLINIWATWCGPCVMEYPNFIALQRMYGARDFEFISLSADKPEHQEKALKFLQKKYSAVPNYLFSKDDKYALIEAIGQKWDGALPFTILVEPGGKVVWQHQGEVDFYELKKVIVDHPKIGRYF